MMATTVISVSDGMADVWAKQFVAVFAKRQKKVEMGGTLDIVPPRFNVLMPGRPKPDEVIKIITSAAKQAAGGTLVFNVGHGASASLTDGTVDLAPNKAFRLGGLNSTNVFTSVFYDFDVDGPGPRMSDLSSDTKFSPQSDRLARWKKYEQVCKAIRDAKIRKVIFLTCKVGNATDFLKKIAKDFNAVVEAYKRQVQLTPQPGGRVRIHLVGDAAGSGTNVPASEENLFSLVAPSGDVVLVGPPP